MSTKVLLLLLIIQGYKEDMYLVEVEDISNEDVPYNAENIKSDEHTIKTDNNVNNKTLKTNTESMNDIKLPIKDTVNKNQERADDDLNKSLSTELSVETDLGETTEKAFSTETSNNAKLVINNEENSDIDNQRKAKDDLKPKHKKHNKGLLPKISSVETDLGETFFSSETKKNVSEEDDFQSKKQKEDPEFNAKPSGVETTTTTVTKYPNGTSVTQTITTNKVNFASFSTDQEINGTDNNNSQTKEDEEATTSELQDQSLSPNETFSKAVQHSVMQAGHVDPLLAKVEMEAKAQEKIETATTTVVELETTKETASPDGRKKCVAVAVMTECNAKCTSKDTILRCTGSLKSIKLKDDDSLFSSKKLSSSKYSTSWSVPEGSVGDSCRLYCPQELGATFALSCDSGQGEASWTGMGKIQRACQALAKEDKNKFFRNSRIGGFRRNSRRD